MHNVCVVLAGKNKASATHVCCELVDLIKAGVHDGVASSLVTEIAYYEIIGFRLSIFVKFQIDAPNPETFPL